MPLAESRNAIGALAEHLAAQLTARTAATTVDIGRPEDAASNNGPKLNIFLYQIDFDGHLRNVPLDRGQEPPIWLALRYLLTAYDSTAESDSAEAQHLLGEALLALRDMSYQEPAALALADNPEPLKITFDHADVQLLSQIMQGTDEKYRISAAFQVRPLLLTTLNARGSAPLIRSVGPIAQPGVLVLPSLGPRLDAIEPASFEMGDAVVLTGGDLAADIVEVCFGTVCVLAPQADVANNRVAITVPSPPVADLSAGSHAVTVVKTLPNGRRFSSNAVLGKLRPTLTAVGHGPLTPSGPNLFGDLTLTGERLGGPDDTIFVGFYRNGRVEALFEASGSAAQTNLTVSLVAEQAVAPGTYLIILRVNSEQALDAPPVNWI
jgi:hypothetical protein